MADKQTISYQVKATLNYEDGDTRTITLDNARNLSEQPETVRNAIDTYGAITIGDKTGAAFTKSTNAQYIQQMVVDLDIEVNNT